MSWSNELILEFLELYKQERILWDSKHPHHRNRSDVTAAWLRIQSGLAALNLDCTIIDIKRKKESLMTAFRFHINRKKLNPHYEPSWFAFKQMQSFLSGRYYNVDDSTNSLDELYEDSVYNAQSQTNIDPISVNVQNHTSKVEKINTSFIEPKPKSLKIKKNFSLSQIEATNSPKETVTDNQNDVDEYELYGQLLAKKLRKLDEHQRDVAMHEIDNIMFRAKMDSITQNRTYTTSSSSSVPPKIKSPLFIVTQSNNSQYEDENNLTYQEPGT